MTEKERLQLEHRLAFRLVTILNTLEKCVSKVKNGFLNDDYHETESTINRLHSEVMEIDGETTERLDE